MINETIQEGRQDPPIDHGQGKTSTTYDSSNCLTKYTSMSGVSYSLTYSGTNCDASTVTSDGVKITYTYDSAGNVTLSKTQATSGGAYLQSSASYDSTKNFKTSSTDVNGSTTQATYSTTKGLVTSTTAANNTVTNQTYYNNDRNYMSYVSGVAAVVNTYNGNGLISRLARKTFLGQAAQWQAYDFEYNDWGQTTSISIRHTNSEDGSGYSSGLKLADYAYADDGGNLEKLTYGNDQYVEYFYDLFDRLVHTVYYDKNNTVQAEYFYVYNAAGQLARQYAVSGGAVTEEYSFSYDSLGRLIRSMELGVDGTVKQRTQHLYDTANRLTSQSWTVGNDTYTESYTYYSGDGSLKAVTTATGDKLTYAYDGLKRLSTATVTNGSGTTLFYTAQNYTDISSSRTTTRPMYYNTRQADGTLLSGNKYEYDAAGNITAIRNSTENFPLLAAYEYDGLNQLTKETRYTYNSAGTQSSTEITYTYDTAGNLLTKTDGSTTSTYTYGNSDWADLLTAFNGQTITYEMEGGKPTGNPTTWHNTTINDYYDMTWEKGRQLSGLKVCGTSQPVSIAYSYDMEGIRTQKTIGNEVHNYITQNGRVIEEAYGNIILKFFYDTNGKPFALRYSNDSGGTWTTMYYVLNLQGDVVKLIGTDGSYYNVYATYTYDAWGNVLSAVSTYTNVPKFANIAQINPLRYRGYYYDTETGFYYLQSRYYDPTVCRFINADFAEYSAVSTLDDTNLFAYCSNNPVSRDDSDGEFWNIVVGAIGGALISGGVQIVSNLISGNKWSDGLGTAVLTGAASGALAATGVGLIGSIAGNAAISMAGNAANQVIKNKGFNNFDVGDMLVDGIIGGVSGAVGGRGMGKAANISTLNKNLTKKLFSGSSKVVGNGIKYYVSQTKAIYINFLFKPLRKSGVASLIGYGAKALFSGVK